MKTFLGVLLGLFPAFAVADDSFRPLAEALDAYNVVWESQSTRSSESMPCGGGDLGLNVWAEDGQLFFYIGRGGTFDENNTVLKLGRVRLTFSPNPFAPGGEFRQELKLRHGHVEVRGKAQDGTHALVRFWVEVHRPVVHIEVEGGQPIEVTATYESWRTDKLLTTDRRRCMGLGKGSTDKRKYPGEVFTWPDTIAMSERGVLFYHRNRNDKLCFDVEVDFMGLGAYKARLWNPLKDLTFGGLLAGKGFVPAGTTRGRYASTDFRGWKLGSVAPAKSHRLKVYLHSAVAPSAEAWRAGLDDLVGRNEPADDEAFRSTLQWWRQFWQRSYVVINPGASPADLGWQVGRNYQLFRYMLGCNALGEWPTKFNGHFFTTDPYYYESPQPTPDTRLWGGGSYTAQNQRLVYWPMLKSGDFSMMPPQFEFYRRGLDAAETWVRHHWGHGGSWFCEQLNNFGLPIGLAYAWNRPTDYDPALVHNGALCYHYTGQLEFSYMILEYHRFAATDIRKWLPFIESAVRFVDEHYRYQLKKRTGRELDEHGRLVMAPGQALESFQDCVNPIDVVAGQKRVLSRLLELPDTYASAAKRKTWRAMLERVPPLPTEDVEIAGDTGPLRRLAPGDSFGRISNQEFPQLYPLFPYDIYGLEKDGLEVARNTWRHPRAHAGAKQHKCWFQGGIYTARLGLTEEAQRYAVKKFLHAHMRFPAFWVCQGYDQEPDCDHGGCAMIGLQEMLLQTLGEEIRLLPAWPREWSCDFRLHAPERTVVEGRVRDGKVGSLAVTPQRRRKDVILTSRRR